MSNNTSTKIDPIVGIKEALETLNRNRNGHNPYDLGAVSSLLSLAPLLVEETEKARKASSKTKGYAVVIHDPDNESVVETQGSVEVFYVDMGGSYDTGNPSAEDARSALQDAAEYARNAARLPKGVVKDTLEGAVEQIVEAYGDFLEAAEGLDKEDKAALAEWLPEAPAVSVA